MGFASVACCAGVGVKGDVAFGTTTRTRSTERQRVDEPRAHHREIQECPRGIVHRPRARPRQRADARTDEAPARPGRWVSDTNDSVTPVNAAPVISVACARPRFVRHLPQWGHGVRSKVRPARRTASCWACSVTCSIPVCTGELFPTNGPVAEVAELAIGARGRSRPGRDGIGPRPSKGIASHEDDEVRATTQPIAGP